MIVAAEASGDQLGAGLARALKRDWVGDLRLMGVGGDAMAAEGVHSPFDISELSILGLFEGLRAYPRVVRRADDVAALARREQPDIVVLIDSWGFTLRVAQRLRRQMPDVTLVKYVAPQVWATRPGRARTLAANVDHLLAIHNFDAPYFEAHGLPVTFVGNAVLAQDFTHADPMRCRSLIGAEPNSPVLLILPGSRPAEIANMLPAFESAALLLKAERPDLHLIVAAASTVAADVRARVQTWPVQAHIVEGEGPRADAMRAATVALACSGTVTTELALAGCPMVIGYRIGPVTYSLAKRMLKTPWITLFNIAMQASIAPEFWQTACDGPRLAKAISDRLDDPSLRQGQIAAQFEALDRMGRGGEDPSTVAARKVIALLAARRGTAQSARVITTGT